MAATEPDKHHYIPCFYTKHWLGQNEKLLEYKKVHGGKIARKEVSPVQTGFVRRLYELKTFPKEVRQDIETVFFSPLDNDACEVLDSLHAGVDPEALSDDERTSWAHFMMSLKFRCPEDIGLLRAEWLEYVSTDLAPEDEAEWRKTFPEAHNMTYREWARTVPPEVVEGEMMNALGNIIKSEVISEALCGLKWQVFDVGLIDFELLSSDRPISLFAPKEEFSMPIGPTKLFIARRTRIYPDQKGLKALVRESNHRVVAAADQLVFARRNDQENFIRGRFGTERQTPLLAEALFYRRKKPA